MTKDLRGEKIFEKLLVNPGKPTKLHQMRGIRDTWMHYRTGHLKPALEGEKEQEIPEDIREEDAMWATIMTNIKKTLVVSQQETVSA